MSLVIYVSWSRQGREEAIDGGAHLPGPAAMLRPGAVDDPPSPPPGPPRAQRPRLVQQRPAAYLLQGLVKVLRSSLCHFVLGKSGFFFGFIICTIPLARVTVNLVIVGTTFLSIYPIFIRFRI